MGILGFAKLAMSYMYEFDPCMQQYGISPEKFLENMDLCNFFKILTNSADSDNKVLAMSNYLFL